MSVYSELCYKNALELAPTFSWALKKLHGVNEKKEIFCGGEDLIFLFEMFYKLNSGEKFEKHIGFEFLADICSSTVAGTTSTRRQRLFANIGLIRIYDLMAYIKRSLRKVFKPSFKKPKWEKFVQKNIIHFSGHRRDDKFVAPNFSRSFKKPPYSFSFQMRQDFKEILLELGISNDIVEILIHITPLSHLENFQYYYKKASGFVRVENVCANIYGIMEDPLLGFIVCVSGANLIYIQHGGSYGILDEPVHKIERTSCEKMLFWGVGENNCYPSKFPVGTVCKKSNNIYIILSHAASKSEALKKISLAKNLIRVLGIKTYVILHPSSSFDIISSLVKKGISFEKIGSANVVLFDDHQHSLIYARIMAGGPFFILESDRNIGAGLFQRAVIFQEIMNELTFSCSAISRILLEVIAEKDNDHDFKFEKLQDLVLKNPKLNELYNVEVI